MESVLGEHSGRAHNREAKFWLLTRQVTVTRRSGNARVSVVGRTTSQGTVLRE
jgi:hypothetical protein